MNHIHAIVALFIVVASLSLTSCGRPNHIEEAARELDEAHGGFEVLGKVQGDKAARKQYYQSVDAVEDARRHVSAAQREQERRFAKAASGNSEDEPKSEKQLREEAEREAAQKRLDDRSFIQKVVPGGPGKPKVKKRFFRNEYVVDND